MFKQSRVHHCIRLCYQVEQQSGYLHMLRSMNIRFFNNLAVTIKTDEERVGEYFLVRMGVSREQH